MRTIEFRTGVIKKVNAAKIKVSNGRLAGSAMLRICQRPPQRRTAQSKTSTYPRALQIVVQCTPLYQGVAIERALTTGAVGPDILVHVLYLSVMGLVGLRVASRRMHVLLQP